MSTSTSSGEGPPPVGPSQFAANQPSAPSWGALTLDRPHEAVAEARRSERAMKVIWLPIAEIDEPPSGLNSRQAYDEISIGELASSVEEHGILQPLCVRPHGLRYRVVFGVRRLKAAIRAGLLEVPCTIQVADDDQAFLLNTIENLHRRQLSGAERVRAIERLAATGLGVRQISRRTGFNASTISRWLRIDRRPALKAALEAERLDVGRATVLVDAPEDALPTLIAEAPSLPQPELWSRVTQLKALHNATRRPADSSRLLEAARLLALVRTVSDDDRRLLDQIGDCLDRLRTVHTNRLRSA